MRPRKLIWQLYFSYLLIMGVPVLIVTLYSAHEFRAFYQQRSMEDLKTRAILIGSQIEEHFASKSARGIDSLCKVISCKVNTRFTVIALSGKVIGDSERDPDSMENHRSRPEVIDALAGKIGFSHRFSRTLLESMMYVAIPVYNAGALCAVVRTALPTLAVRAALNRLYGAIAGAVLLMALISALASYLVSRKVSRPIAEMRLGAQRFASGDFSLKLPLSGYMEAGELAAGLNEMARQLNERLGTITQQKNELDAVLSSMIEGVVAVEADERIIILNRAAKGLFNIAPEGTEGKWIGEAIRNTDVQDFFGEALRSPGPTEREIVVLSQAATAAPELSSERFLQLHGSALRDAEGNSIGALMVVNDITRIKLLEKMRKDFVANVSHELRTPLTSIKGFVETLQGGAVNNREEAQRFLGIVANQVDRLNTIVEDLLSLSKIERDDERNAVELAPGSVSDVVAEAIDTCRRNALQKGITFELAFDKTLIARMEPSLLEQAVVNLIDNAIKYSDENKRIWVAAEKDPAAGGTVISVRDEGLGIGQEHLGRIFERFYRVDKARSRKLGGTGLGLSIVKHIVLAHHGRVDVESTAGKGSTFTIRLPAAG